MTCAMGSGTRFLSAVLAASALCCGAEREARAPVASAEEALAPAPPAPTELASLGYVDFTEVEDDGESGVLLRDEARSAPGYDLYVSIPFARAALIDAAGNSVARWSDPLAKAWVRCELLPDGDVLVLGALDSDGANTGVPRAYVARLGFDGTLRWRTPLAAHHDLEWTPRGEIVVLTLERRELDPKLGWPPLLDNLVVRMSADGRVLESHSLGDLLDVEGRAPSLGVEGDFHELPAGDRDAFAVVLAEVEAFAAADRTASAWPRETTAPAAPSDFPVDLIHANAVHWIERPELADRGPLYASGNVLVTLRHQDEIAVFRWETGLEVWRFGRGVLQGPHEASLLANGNVLVFDNGIRGRRHSRIVEVDPATEEIVWSWSAPEPSDFYCTTRGTCHELPGGNVLVCNSERGEAFEVTRAGEIVWRFVAPERDEEGRRAAIRLRRYAPDEVEPFLGRR